MITLYVPWTCIIRNLKHGYYFTKIVLKVLHYIQGKRQSTQFIFSQKRMFCYHYIADSVWKSHNTNEIHY